MHVLRHTQNSPYVDSSDKRSVCLWCFSRSLFLKVLVQIVPLMSTFMKFDVTAHYFNLLQKVHFVWRVFIFYFFYKYWTDHILFYSLFSLNSLGHGGVILMPYSTTLLNKGSKMIHLSLWSAWRVPYKKDQVGRQDCLTTQNVSFYLAIIANAVKGHKSQLKCNHLI